MSEIRFRSIVYLCAWCGKEKDFVQLTFIVGRGKALHLCTDCAVKLVDKILGDHIMEAS